MGNNTNVNIVFSLQEIGFILIALYELLGKQISQMFFRSDYMLERFKSLYLELLVRELTITYIKWTLYRIDIRIKCLGFGRCPSCATDNKERRAAV